MAFWDRHGLIDADLVIIYIPSHVEITCCSLGVGQRPVYDLGRLGLYASASVRPYTHTYDYDYPLTDNYTHGYTNTYADALPTGGRRPRCIVQR